MDRERKELMGRVHTGSEMAFYNIRCLRTQPSLHRNPGMLDSKYLVNKLYEYYDHFYHQLYFRETMTLILYWAYQKDLLDHVISEEALKLIVICIFINFGYGVNNIVCIETQQHHNIQLFKQMNSYSRVNSRGDTEVMPELATQF